MFRFILPRVTISLKSDTSGPTVMNTAHLSLCAVFALLSLPASAGAPGSSWASGFESLNNTTRLRTRLSRASDTGTLPPPYLRLPVFVHSRLPIVKKDYFSPRSGKNREPLPHAVREALLPAFPKAAPRSPSGVSLYVKAKCSINKMHVEVQKSVLGAGGLPSQLKLGTCQASRDTQDSLYFEYDLDLCGSKRTINFNIVSFSNILRYNPPSLLGPIRRAAPFSLLVACHYNRFQYSYKIGYTPKMRMRTVFKPMRSKVKFILSPRNAQWERLSPSDHYNVGKPMYFEVEAPSLSTDGRLYVHSCHATLKKSHTSTPQFSVVENFGCMTESKASHSRFIPHTKNVVRFSVDAFLFKGMTGQQLYMHCTASVGPSAPTPTAKACNYDQKTRRWVEVYGSDSVCACCDSSCSSAASSGMKTRLSPVTKMISSKAWTIEDEVKPTASLKRKKTKKMTTATKKTTTATKKITTTTKKTATTTKKITTTTKKTATTTKKITTAMPKTRTTSQPEERRRTLAGKELKRPFGGRGGVKRVGAAGEERQVKGFAVVKEEQLTKPRLVFEEVFGLDK